VKKSNLLFIGLITLALLLSITNFYSFGYLIVIALGAYPMRFSATFSSFFSRIIVSALLLSSTIMVVGLASWFLHLTVHASVVTVTFLLLVLALNYKNKWLQPQKEKLFDLSDGVSLGAGLLLPVVILLGYFVPFTNASLYQLLSNGWDNAAHVVMLETASIEKGYVYGNLEEVQHRTINKTNAYPQAWHLATSNIADGFGGRVFDPQNPILVLKSYTIVIVLWFILAAYSASKVAWSLTAKIRKKPALPHWAFVGLFLFLNIVTQLLAHAGSLLNGFANYLGLLAFTAVFISCLIDADLKKPNRSLLIMAVITSTAGALCWFLPWPSFVASFALVALASYKLLPIRRFISTNKLLLGTAFVFSAAVIAQILLFEQFTYESGAELLVTNGGAYKVSELLIGGMLIASTIFLYKNHKSDIFKTYLFILCPFILMIVGVYTYQLILSEQLTYYYYKLTMLFCLAIMTFVIPIAIVGFDTIYKKLGKSTLLTLLAVPTVIGLVLIVSQQTLKPFHFALQSNSNVTYSTARAITRYLEKEDPKTTKLIVMTNRYGEKPPKFENSNGDLVTSVAHLPYTCTYNVFNTTGSLSIKAALKRLERCADETDNKIIVVVNFKTKPLVDALNKPNIKTVTVK
jgi:hypothetical protein